MNLLMLAIANGVHFCLKLRQCLKSLAYSVPLFVILGPFNALAVDCRGYLEQMRPYVKSLRAFVPRPGLVPIEPEVLEFVKIEGGSVAFVGKGEFGRVFRWEKLDGSRAVIKCFTDYHREVEDQIINIPWQKRVETEDKSFKVLRQLIRPEDGVMVVNEIRPPQGRFRFYKYVAGETLRNFLQNERVPLNNRLEVLKVYHDLQSTLVDRMRMFYGARNVKVEGFNSPANASMPFDLYWNMISVSSETYSPVTLVIHIHNVIVEASTGQLWIIDPL